MSEQRNRKISKKDKIVDAIVEKTWLSLAIILVIYIVLKNFMPNEPIIDSVFYATIPALIISFLYQRSYDKHMEENMDKYVDEFNSKIENIIANVNKSCILCKNNIKYIAKNRASVNLIDFFSSSKKDIMVYVTNLDTVSDDATLAEFYKLLSTNSKIKIRILAMDPSHPFVINRNLDLSKVVDYSKITSENLKTNKLYYEIISSLSKYVKFKKGLPENLSKRFIIKLYLTPPTFIMFGRDHEIIISFILHKITSRNTMHIHFDTSVDNQLNHSDGAGYLTSGFTQHFNDLWNGITEMNINQLESYIEKAKIGGISFSFDKENTSNENTSGTK